MFAFMLVMAGLCFVVGIASFALPLRWYVWYEDHRLKREFLAGLWGTKSIAGEFVTAVQRTLLDNPKAHGLEGEAYVCGKNGAVHCVFGGTAMFLALMFATFAWMVWLKQ